MLYGTLLHLSDNTAGIEKTYYKDLFHVLQIQVLQVLSIKNWMAEPPFASPMKTCRQLLV